MNSWLFSALILLGGAVASALVHGAFELLKWFITRMDEKEDERWDEAWEEAERWAEQRMKAIRRRWDEADGGLAATD